MNCRNNKRGVVDDSETDKLAELVKGVDVCAKAETDVAGVVGLSARKIVRGRT